MTSDSSIPTPLNHFIYNVLRDHYTGVVESSNLSLSDMPPHVFLYDEPKLEGDNLDRWTTRFTFDVIDEDLSFWPILIRQLISANQQHSWAGFVVVAILDVEGIGDCIMFTSYSFEDSKMVSFLTSLDFEYMQAFDTPEELFSDYDMPLASH